MTIKAALAYGLIACYFGMERLLRKGQPALNLTPGAEDAGSSQGLWLSGLLSLLLVLAAPVLNTHQIGHWNTTAIGWAGLAVMVGGLALRYWAAKTLDRFYTRTLQIVEGQTLVEKAPYSVIRHPGYLGTLLLELGAGLAVRNWIVLLVALTFAVAARSYRIAVEEKMLEASFGEACRAYSSNIWRLFPFLY